MCLVYGVRNSSTELKYADSKSFLFKPQRDGSEIPAMRQICEKSRCAYRMLGGVSRGSARICPLKTDGWNGWRRSYDSLSHRHFRDNILSVEPALREPHGSVSGRTCTCVNSSRRTHHHFLSNPSKFVIPLNRPGDLSVIADAPGVLSASPFTSGRAP